MFQKLFGQNFVGVNVTNVQLVPGTFEFYILPSVNISFNIHNSNLTIDNLTSILNSLNIESAFKEYSVNSSLRPFLLLNSIHGCNGSFINSNFLVLIFFL